MKHIDKEILDPSKKRAYKKMMRTFKKNLIKKAKESTPWDSCFGVELFVEFLKWMHEYYKLGYNVWALDVDPFDPENKIKTRAETLEETLKFYNRWQECTCDYYKIARSDEEIKHYEKLGFHVLSVDGDDIEQSCRKSGMTTLTLYTDSKVNAEMCHQAEQSYKHKFFECLEQHLEEWWD